MSKRPDRPVVDPLVLPTSEREAVAGFFGEAADNDHRLQALYALIAAAQTGYRGPDGRTPEAAVNAAVRKHGRELGSTLEETFFSNRDLAREIAYEFTAFTSRR